MKKNILAVLVVYSQEKKTASMFVAFETEPGFFKAATLSVQAISDYMINRTVEAGRTVPEDRAKVLFPDIMEHCFYDHTPQPEVKVDALGSLSDLYEKAKDLALDVSADAAGKKTAELLDVLKHIRDLAAPAIMRAIPQMEDNPG